MNHESSVREDGKADHSGVTSDVNLLWLLPWACYNAVRKVNLCSRLHDIVAVQLASCTGVMTSVTFFKFLITSSGTRLAGSSSSVIEFPPTEFHALSRSMHYQVG